MKNDTKTKKVLLEEFEKLEAENKRLKLANKKHLAASQIIKGIGAEAELMTLNDPIEKKRAEEALKISEASFRSVINSIQDLVYTLDTNQNITGLYGMWSEMYGFTEEEFIGKKLTTFLSPPQTTINEIATLRALNGEAIKFEWTLKKNEDTFYFESSLTPLFGKDNDVIGVVGVA
ncbi:MAG: PAS domain-containing protein, partial [Melioribacteraceae bacterium]